MPVDNRSHTRDAEPCRCPLCSSPFVTSPGREKRPEDDCREPIARDTFKVDGLDPARAS